MSRRGSILEGLICEDRFVGRVAAGLRTEPVQLVIVPPGRELDDAAMALEAVALDVHVSTLRPVRARVDRDDDLIRALEEHFGAEPSPTASPESFILQHTERLAYPRSFLVPLRSSAEEDGAAVVRSAVALAEGTKNLSGPMTFVLLAERTCHGGTVQGAVVKLWEPLEAWPEHLPFGEEAGDLEGLGFRVYLSWRIYWEACGQPSSMRRIGSLHLRTAELLCSADADARIDAAFDVAARELDPGLLERWSRLFEAAFEPRTAQVVLRTGFVVGARLPRRELVAAGLAWCPPGGPHGYITGPAARLLSRSGGFRARWRLEERQAASFRRAVHQNYFLASWVGGLTALVEYGMMTLCQTDPGIEAKIARLGMEGSLRVAQERNPSDLMYDPPDDLLGYASFGELQRLISETELSHRFPVSKKRLNEVRNVRNLVAHLHPVGWPAVRAVLQALREMRVGA